MSSHVGYLAHWRAGTGAQRWRSGMSLDEFKAESKKQFDDGRRLESIDVYRFSDVPKKYSFSAVWRPGTGSQQWRSGMNVNEFKKEVELQEKSGRLIYTLDRREDGEIIAVFRPGSGGQWWRSGMSWDEFKKEDAKHFKDGFRVQVLKRYKNVKNKYLAVWRSGSGKQICRGGMSSGDFKKWADTHAKEGLRLHWVDKSLHDGRFTAVWRPGSGGEWIHFAIHTDDMKATDKDFFDNNHRLHTLRRVRMSAARKTGPDFQIIHLRQQQVHEGNHPYIARFPAIAFIKGNLTGVTNAGNSSTLAFLKPANTTADCTKTSAVVRLKPQEKMSAKDIEAIWGSARPSLPIWFVACATAPAGATVAVRVDFNRL